jgi:hypothetical protein
MGRLLERVEHLRDLTVDTWHRLEVVAARGIHGRPSTEGFLDCRGQWHTWDEDAA